MLLRRGGEDTTFFCVQTHTLSAPPPLQKCSRTPLNVNSNNLKARKKADSRWNHNPNPILKFINSPFKVSLLPGWVKRGGKQLKLILKLYSRVYQQRLQTIHSQTVYNFRMKKNIIFPCLVFEYTNRHWSNLRFAVICALNETFLLELWINMLHKPISLSNLV